MYYKKVGESSNTYARYVFLNELIAGQDQAYIEDLLVREQEFPLRVNPEEMYILITGLKKAVYHGHYQLSTNKYMEIYVQFENKVRDYLEQNRYDGEIVLHLYEDKQICVLFSAKDKAAATPMQIAEFIQDCLQSLYQDYFLKDDRHCNQTYFYPSAITLVQIAQVCKELMQLCKLSFFWKKPMVFTADRLEVLKRRPDRAEVQELFTAFTGAVDSGAYEVFAHTLRAMQRIVRHSFDFYFLEELMQELKHFYIQCSTAYDVPMIPGIDAYFDCNMYEKEERLFEAMHTLFYSCTERIGHHGQKYSPIIQAALKIIKTGYRRESISLTYVARQIGVSPAYLSSVFNKEVRTTIPRYITTLRLEEAALLLANPELKTKDISKSVGYENHKYFVNVFKQRFGCAPKEYRQKASRQKVNRSAE